MNITGQSLLVALAAVLGMVFFLWCVLRSLFKPGPIWKALPYLTALVPVLVHAYNHGFGRGTLIAAILFLALTKLIVYLAAKECGVKGS